MLLLKMEEGRLHIRARDVGKARDFITRIGSKAAIALARSEDVVDVIWLFEAGLLNVREEPLYSPDIAVSNALYAAMSSLGREELPCKERRPLFDYLIARPDVKPKLGGLLMYALQRANTYAIKCLLYAHAPTVHLNAQQQVWYQPWRTREENCARTLSAFLSACCQKRMPKDVSRLIAHTIWRQRRFSKKWFPFYLVCANLFSTMSILRHTSSLTSRPSSSWYQSALHMSCTTLATALFMRPFSHS